MTFDALQRMTDAIEQAICDVLRNAVQVPFFPTLGNDSKDGLSQWGEVELDPGQATGHRQPLPDGSCPYDTFHSSLTIRLRSNHTLSVTPEAHRQAIGKIMWAMLPGLGLFTTANLPRHQLLTCTPQGRPVTVKQDSALNATDCHFQALCCIRPGAWRLAFPVSHTADSTTTFADSTILTADAA